ncbi:MAG TPA: mechanosensitive ion channel [Spirochaetota bacterium]|nr:mechanosensitive ion channel [Spirochaetota bacterium]HPP48639.1 mechanosensitive ion channel [Spirochaetota bacterium]
MIESVLAKTFFGNSVRDYCISVLIFIFALCCIFIFKRIIIRKLKSIVQRTNTVFDDIIIRAFENSFLPVTFIISLYVSILQLSIEPVVRKAINICFLVFFTISGVSLVVKGVGIFISVIIQRQVDTTKQRALRALNPLLKVIIWIFASYFLLENLGIKLTPLIAGLGIGGLAIGLAAQNVLGDLFAYFVMLFDRPFEIDDFIIVDTDLMGTVENIGIKSSKIRSLGGEQIIISNSNLINARVRNYKRMHRRRVVFRIGVTYETKIEQLKMIPGLIKEIVSNIDNATFDRAHFFSYGDFSLQYEIVYYVESNDYNLYMDIQQEINFKIKEAFEEHEIEFAYPTSMVYIAKDIN